MSRDGRGRALDNVFVERLWRSVKYEDLYIKDYERAPELELELRSYFWFYERSVPISHSITGPLARSIGPGFTGAERGKALTNAGGLSGPSFGVHYNHSTAGPPAWAVRKPTASAGGITTAGKPGHNPR